MKSTRIITPLILTLFLISISLHGEEAKTDSKQLFYNTLKPLQNAESYEVEGKVVYTINSDNANEKPQQQEQLFKVTTKGNDLNFLSINTPQGNIQVFRNGNILTIYSEKEKKFLEREAPTNVKLFMLVGAPSLLDSIVYGDSELVPKLTIQQIENSSNNTENQFQIKTEKNEEINIWFSKENEPKLTRVQAPIPTSTITSGGTMDIYFNNWKLNSVTDETIFKFNPPSGVSKVEKKEPKDVMVGQKAPDFTLSTLDGKEISLKDFQDKKVVVLDFWATWCPPCRRAMPIIQELSNELKDKDVIFFAVNVDEEKAKVADFIKNMGITLTVLLDKGAKVSISYKVESIPRMVIIGKDGVVKAGHAGFSADMKEGLKKEILEALK